MIKKIVSIFVILMMGMTLSGCELIGSSAGPYQISYDSNGGSALETVEVDANQTFLPSQVPTKEGYVFSGWYLDPNFLYPIAFNAGVTQSLTLYAKWEEESNPLSETEIRDIIDAILLEQDLILTDEVTITNIVNALVEDGTLVDEAAIVSAVLSNIDVVALMEEHVTSMLADVKRSVVMVDCYNGFILESSGSGVIYKKVGSIYYVLTNEHVVYGYTSSEFQITIFETNGDIVITKGNVTLLGKSVTHDMAILRFSSLQSLRVIEWGTKDSLKVGQMVFAIGSPLDLPNSVSMGTISAIDRGMWDDYGMDTITIQHTATINPGNSGGALVNIYGQMIGLNNMSYVDEYVGEGIEGLHFAIQIDILTQMIPTLE